MTLWLIDDYQNTGQNIDIWPLICLQFREQLLSIIPGHLRTVSANDKKRYIRSVFSSDETLWSGDLNQLIENKPWYATIDK